jgi:ribosome biogenesis GTPase / thiamine phosphate phosphatase
MIDLDILPHLRRIGLSPPVLQQLAQFEGADPGERPMRITEVQRDALQVHDGTQELPARAVPALLQALAAQGDALAVGDWVLAQRNVHGQWWVLRRPTPVTQIARRLHDGRDKVTRMVIVSNVDTALLVMGLDLDFNVRRLERYLALVRLAGVAAVVVLTKVDLCTGAEADARLQAVQALLPADTVAVAVNAQDDSARQALQPWLTEGSTLVLLGSSGAGKSTLTNALLGEAVQRTGAARLGDGRGRHTTTSRSLHVTPGGACIIDTPGLRTLRLDGDAESIGAVFDDIARLAPQCRFRDCRHQDEPGCAVRATVEPERLRNFQKMMREAERDTLTALQRKAQVAVWKARGRAAKAVGKAKRG